MKNRVKTIVLALVVATITFAFTPIEDGVKEVKVETSSVTWKGYKVTGSHTGSIALKEGSLEFKDEKLVGGDLHRLRRKFKTHGTYDIQCQWN